MTDTKPNTPPTEQEIADFADALVRLVDGKAADLIIPGIAGVLLAAVDAPGTSPEVKKIRAAFIMGAAMKAADAAELTDVEMIAIMEKHLIATAARVVSPPNGVVEAVSALSGTGEPN